MLKITKSLAMIALVVIAVAGATQASFRSGKVAGANTFSIGNVNVGQQQGLPLKFENMAPGGEYVSNTISLQYAGTIPADLYVGMKWQDASQNGDFRNILEYAIEKVDGNGNNISWVTGWTGIGDIFARWKSIATNVTKGQWNYYKIHVRVKANADNQYQNGWTKDYIIVYSTEHGAPAPGSAPENWNLVQDTQYFY